MKKSALTTILATLGFAALAAGPVATVTKTATNTFTYVSAYTAPVYIESIDIGSSAVTTSIVTLAATSDGAFTNTVYANTGTVVRYFPAEPLYRIEKGGTLSISFSSALTTNTVSLMLYMK
jgi:hypothetical protein